MWYDSLVAAYSLLSRLFRHLYNASLGLFVSRELAKHAFSFFTGMSTPFRWMIVLSLSVAFLLMDVCINVLCFFLNLPLLVLRYTIGFIFRVRVQGAFVWGFPLFKKGISLHSSSVLEKVGLLVCAPLVFPFMAAMFVLTFSIDVLINITYTCVKLVRLLWNAIFDPKVSAKHAKSKQQAASHKKTYGRVKRAFDAACAKSTLGSKKEIDEWRKEITLLIDGYAINVEGSLYDRAYALEKQLYLISDLLGMVETIKDDFAKDSTQPVVGAHLKEFDKKVAFSREYYFYKPLNGLRDVFYDLARFRAEELNFKRYEQFNLRSSALRTLRSLIEKGKNDPLGVLTEHIKKYKKILKTKEAEKTRTSSKAYTGSSYGGSYGNSWSSKPKNTYGGGFWHDYDDFFGASSNASYGRSYGSSWSTKPQNTYRGGFSSGYKGYSGTSSGASYGGSYGNTASVPSKPSNALTNYTSKLEKVFNILSSYFRGSSWVKPSYETVSLELSRAKKTFSDIKVGLNKKLASNKDPKYSKAELDEFQGLLKAFEQYLDLYDVSLAFARSCFEGVKKSGKNKKDLEHLVCSSISKSSVGLGGRIATNYEEVRKTFIKQMQAYVTFLGNNVHSVLKHSKSFASKKAFGRVVRDFGLVESLLKKACKAQGGTMNKEVEEGLILLQEHLYFLYTREKIAEVLLLIKNSLQLEDAEISMPYLDQVKEQMCYLLSKDEAGNLRLKSRVNVDRKPLFSTWFEKFKSAYNNLIANMAICEEAGATMLPATCFDKVSEVPSSTAAFSEAKEPEARDVCEQSSGDEEDILGCD